MGKPQGRSLLASLLLLATTFLPGCLDLGIGGTVSPAGAAFARPPFVVVAYLDTGINPYHEAFRAPGAPPLSSLVPGLHDVRRLNLTFGGSYAANLRADNGTWSGVEPFVLHEFPGTRALGISFPSPNFTSGQVGAHKILDDNSHGTMVAGRILQANPDAYVVAVEAGSDGMAPALNWVAEQEWIDVVSISFETYFDLPLFPVLPEIVQALKIASLDKLVVVANGNQPTVSWLDVWGGEPWVIGVGGSQEGTRGEMVWSSKSPDFVADYYRQNLPTHDSVDGYTWNAGTSFSTPYVAGSLSKIVLTLRERLGDKGPYPSGGAAQNETLTFTLWDAQEALNRTAEYWTPTEWSPGDAPSPTEDPEAFARHLQYAGLPVAPEAGPVGPWVQMGWGAVVNGTADAAAHALLSGSLPEKPSAAVEYMKARQDLREAYWRVACPECYG